MKLTIKRYTAVLSIQTILLLIDFSINIFSILAKRHSGISLILFIVQCACLILAIATLLFTFFTTSSFHAGLVSLFYDKFRISLLIYLIYLILTTALNIAFLVTQRNGSDKLNWSSGCYSLFILQRMVTPVYYYYYKRATLHIGDPRFHDDMLWDEGNINNTN